MQNISVIIPVYNRELLLSEAIESALSQTYKNFEIIIIDDGSTDGSRDIIQSYHQRYPAIIKTARISNSGPAAARNYGASLAAGDLLSFLDSDDIWSPNKLELQAKTMERSPQFVLIYAFYKHFFENGQRENNNELVRTKEAPQGNILSKLLMSCFISTITVLLKKNIFLEMGGFNELIHIGEDYDLWLRIANKHQIGCVPEVLAWYRQHADNIMKSDFINDIPSDTKIVEGFIENNPEVLKKINYSLLLRRLSAPYFDRAYYYVHNGQLQEARAAILCAIKRYPWKLDYYRYLLATFLPKSLFISI
jgi:glycosyltransferase involved in cell wall biosynthesis